MPSSQQQWTHETSNWQHQGAPLQQRQQMVQHQIPQFPQAMQHPQHTQQSQNQHMQMQSQSNTGSGGYEDTHFESMQLTQFQPLEYGVRGGQGLDDIDFDGC
jgi:hypothetical protein